MSIEQIANEGNTLETLKALRQKLAYMIDRCESGRDVSSLARQLQIVIAQINQLEEEDASGDPIAIIIEKNRGRSVRGARGRVTYEADDLDLDLSDPEEV